MNLTETVEEIIPRWTLKTANLEGLKELHEIRLQDSDIQYLGIYRDTQGYTGYIRN